MTEPTIICPNCKTEIKLTESLAAPLIEVVRKQLVGCPALVASIAKCGTSEE